MEFTRRQQAYIAAFVVVVSTLIIVFLYPNTTTRTNADKAPSEEVSAGGSAGQQPRTRDNSVSETTAVPSIPDDTTEGPVATSPDGTPLTGGAPEELFPEPDDTQSTGTVPPTAGTVTPTDSTVPVSNLGPLDRAEAFVEAYFTYFEIDTAESWKARVSEHVTDSLAEQLSFADVEEGVGLRAVMDPIEEGLGEVSDVGAEFPLRVNVEKYVDDKFVGEQTAIVYVVLENRNGAWLVASYRFNE